MELVCSNQARQVPKKSVFFTQKDLPAPQKTEVLHEKLKTVLQYDFAATKKLKYIVFKKLIKSYLGKMTGELSKGYLARVNLREKGLESAEIILQVNQINPLGNGKYGLIVHDCQNQMKALLNSSMSGLVRGESLIDGTTRT